MRTLRLVLERKKKALIIVAHPDDETIWMGGAILRYRDLDWTIFALCRASDPDRAPKFKRVCAHFGAHPIIADLEDEGIMSIKESIPKIKKILKQKIVGKHFDYVFTHGANGEYGHPRHKGVHKAVVDLVGEKKIKTENLFFFSYKKRLPRPFSPVTPQISSSHNLTLKKEEFAAKKKVMSSIYGFDPKGIDISYCTRTEGFKTPSIHNL